MLSFVSALPIFPVRLQTSIFGRSELNFRVRNGNGWTLALISTDFVDADFVSFAAALAPRLIHSIASPLPHRPALAGLCSEFMLFGIFYRLTTIQFFYLNAIGVVILVTRTGFEPMLKA